MQWKLFATLAESADGHEHRVNSDAADPTVRDALDALLADYPDLAEAVLDGEGDIRDHVRLLVDGTDPFREADGWETPVDADAELALFPPVSGG